MLRRLYKRLIKKLHLSVEQLRILKEKLTLDNICVGSFVEEKKMCPNTTALAMKQGVKSFSSEREVRHELNHYGITNRELWLFYLLFDIPAKVSRKFFKKGLISMQTAIDELIYSKV